MNNAQKSYKVFAQLLAERNITPYRIYKDTGVPQSSMSEWKRGNSVPKYDKLQKISEYFNVSVDYLLGEEQKQKTPTLTKKDERTVTDDDIKFALFGDTDIDDDVFDSVKDFAKFAAEQRKKNKEGE